MVVAKVPSCPHITELLLTADDISKLEKQSKKCSKCDYAGPNLWICLQRNCLNVGCSEQAFDHSTEHFQKNKTHCAHLNMTSYRIWCYMCEREVFTTDKKSLHSPADVPGDVEFDSAFELSLIPIGSGLVGMQNIANTCYMNSALQALSNIQPMTHYFLNCAELIEQKVDTDTTRNKTGLAKSYLRLMLDIWCTNRDNNACIAPRGILYGIRSVHPMFRGFQQHDTQEFLRCFMDQLHEELKDQTVRSHDYISTNSNEADQDSDDYSTHNSVSESEYETCDSSASENSNDFVNTLSYNTLSSKRKSTGTQHSQQQATNRSIITDIFDGKLLSSVQCLTCDRISTREETFQDLSLPIPNRDYLNMLHQNHSLSAQNLNLVDNANTRQNEHWFSWMWSLFRSWLWGPSVTLHDCMASFFSADELKGDNMYSCEKCNKLRTGVKYSQILDLPEVLCIHLKRFRHDIFYSSKISSHVQFPLEAFDMGPYLHKNCESQVVLYNLVSVICHHGTVGGGHYTCFARNGVTNSWYEYDDQLVTEIPTETVQNCQAYVLFYRKNNPQMDLVRAEANQLSISNPILKADICFYVAREWLVRFNTFAEPGPINNWAILCPHGGIVQTKINSLKQIAVPISQPLWDFLYRKFGGGPVINMLYECAACKRIAEALSRRQYYELSVFSKYNGIDADVDSSAIFAISMPWLRKWQQFVRGVSPKEPGPITNSNIANTNETTQASTFISNVRPGSDYAQLKAPLWRFLHGIYGGGPEIILRGSCNYDVDPIDEVKYGRKNKVESNDLSDTESNIGQQIFTDYNSKEKKPTGSRATVDQESDDPDQSSLVELYDIFNHNQYTKPAKTAVIRSSMKNKHIKSRNSIRKTDLFGVKGNYIQHKHFDNGEDDSTQIKPQYSSESFKIKSNAFSNKTHKTFPNQSENKSECPRNRTEDNRISRKSRMRGKLKCDHITLKKFTHLQESSESTETDV